MALNQIADVDVSKLEEICVWPGLSSSCCFLQNRALASPALLQGPSFHSMGERTMAMGVEATLWSPQKAWGTCTKKADVSEEWSKPPWARPKCCNFSPHPLLGDQGTHYWCFWYCSQWIINTTHNSNSAEGLAIVGWCWWGKKCRALDFSYEMPLSTLKTLNTEGKKPTCLLKILTGLFHQFWQGVAPQ